jgi:hypothetical protein
MKSSSESTCMFGKHSEKQIKYWTIRIDGDDPRVRRIWFIVWYSFVSLIFATSFSLVLVNAPFNIIGIFLCLLAFTAYILNTQHMQFMAHIHRSPYWFFGYLLLFLLYINYIHHYVSILYWLNIFIAWVSFYNRFHKLTTPTDSSGHTSSP